MALLVVLLAALVLAGCGNSEDVTITQSTTEASRQDGETSTTEETTTTTVTSTTGPPPDEDTAPSGGTGGVHADAESCGGGVYVDSSTTSCAFGRNVAADYYSSSSDTFESFSPATGETYEMTCSGPPPIVCTGGDNATVYLTHA